MVKMIIFDLDGVFLDGSFDNFIHKLSNILPEPIQLPLKDIPSSLQNNVDCGIFDIFEIIEHLVSISSRQIYKIRPEITKLYNDNWVPNIGMRMMATMLHFYKGVDIGIASNLSLLNANYFIKNYDTFFINNIIKPQNIFFSCKIGYVKPSIEFYNHILTKTSLEPYEILFIDDSKDNVDAAINIGMKAIKFSNREESLDNLLAKILAILMLM